MTRPFSFLLSLLLALNLLLCAALAARAAASDERRQLQQTREAVEARFKRDSLACQQHFIVNTCLDGARAERIASLRPLQVREEALAAQDRQERSEAQAKRVAERQREFAAEEGRRRTEALQAGPAPARGTGTVEIGPGPHAPPVDPEAHARAIRRQADEAAQAAAREREQSNRRQRLVLQQREDYQRRQDEREASGRKPGKPLPIPSAAEMAAASSAAGLPLSAAASAASSGKR